MECDPLVQSGCARCRPRPVAPLLRFMQPDRLRRLYQVARAAFTSDGHTTYLNLTPRSDEIKEISSSRVRAD